MSVKRPQGIETEYGIRERRRANSNFVLLSSLIVQGYARHVHQPRILRWDYHGEDPLNDARGFRMQRASAHPSMLTDDPNRPAPSGDTASGDAPSGGEASEPTQSLKIDDLGEAMPAVPVDLTTINVALVNGGRLYVDHAHPEYCTPEVNTPREAVLWDQAGEVIMTEILDAMDGQEELALYKNNTDGKGSSYGTHENYCVSRDVPFAELAQLLLPFFVTRQIICGSGRVGIGQNSETPGFQLAQRSDFMENDIGLETTMRRPIVNTRDEPHADYEQFRRLHVIIGDANTYPMSTLLKHGTTSLVLWLAEQAHQGNQGARQAVDELLRLKLADPVGAVQQVSHDLSLTQPLQLADGREVTAIEIQRQYLNRIQSVLTGGAGSGEDEVDEDTAEILSLWQDVLAALADKNFAAIADTVEWVGKYQVLNAQIQRKNLDWSAPEIQALDLQWADLWLARSIYKKLAAAGKIKQLFTTGEIAAACTNPPSSSRAGVRGELIKDYADKIYSMGWKSVVIQTSEGRLQRLNLPEPARAQGQDILDYVEKA